MDLKWLWELNYGAKGLGLFRRLHTTRGRSEGSLTVMENVCSENSKSCKMKIFFYSQLKFFYCLRVFDRKQISLIWEFRMLSGFAY